MREVFFSIVKELPIIKLNKNKFVRIIASAARVGVIGGLLYFLFAAILLFSSKVNQKYVVIYDASSVSSGLITSYSELYGVKSETVLSYYKNKEKYVDHNRLLIAEISGLAKPYISRWDRIHNLGLSKAGDLNKDSCMLLGIKNKFDVPDFFAAEVLIIPNPNSEGHISCVRKYFLKISGNN